MRKSERLRRKLKRAICAILFAVIVVSAQYYRYLNMELTVEGGSTLYQLKMGSSLYKVAADLEAMNILPAAKWFVYYARATGTASNIKVGEYKINTGDTPLQLLAMMIKGSVVQYSVTLVEGWTFKQALEEIHRHDKITPTLKGLSTEELMIKIDRQGEFPEGKFFPDTYSYYLGTTDAEILEQAYQKLVKTLTEEWFDRDKNVPYKNRYEALIMASIVEKETGLASERSEIAGVFVRRLDQGMRLQTDPTVIYGLGSDYKGNIRKKHLSQPSEYNTYMIHGLPPTPIALVGREAIVAALHPAEGESLYFVAKGDGSHYFSKTFKEHNEAVKKYQILNRKKNYTSSPQ